MPHLANPAKAVCDLAVERESPAARAALLDRECAGDPALRQRVEALLLAYADAGGVLDRSPWPPWPPPPASRLPWGLASRTP